MEANVNESVLVEENAEPVSADHHEERRNAHDVEDVVEERIQERVFEQDIVDLYYKIGVDAGRYGPVAPLVDDRDGFGGTDRSILITARHTLDDLQGTVVRRQRYCLL